LTYLIQTKYIEVVAALTREFRIFTGANAVVFGLLAAIAYFRPKKTSHLVLPTIILIGSTVLAGGIYIFAQDWIHTIVFSDYIGFAYFLYLGLTVAFMTDIFINRGRVSARIIDFFGILFAFG
jgi:hypothetical protein